MTTLKSDMSSLICDDHKSLKTGRSQVSGSRYEIRANPSSFLAKSSGKRFSSDVKKIIVLTLAPLIFVLIWIGLMYDKLASNPTLAILLILGVLTILYGGILIIGPVKIQKKVRRYQKGNMSMRIFGLLHLCVY